jgi:RNA polymerase primary sigma factor
MNADDIRKIVDSLFEKLSPAKAQEVAKSLLGDDRREQAQKLATDLIEAAQRNRDRVKDLADREVKSQLTTMGLATKAEVDALAKRLRALEKGAPAKSTTRKTAARKPTTRKSAAKKSTARKTTAARAVGDGSAAGPPAPSA